MRLFYKNKKLKIDVKLNEDAKNGDPKSQLMVSDLYFNYRKYDMAFYWCKKSADNNYAPAYFKLSSYYLNGKGVEQNIELAVKYLDLAVLHNDRNALFNMGVYLHLGHYYPKDEKKSIELLRRSAKLGNLNAKEYVKQYEDNQKREKERALTYKKYDDIQKDKQEILDEIFKNK